MKPLTDEKRKRLTSYLGECWHEWIVAYPQEGEDESTDYRYRGHKCAKCNTYYPVQLNDGPLIFHSFTTYEDLGKLKDKLVENGEFWGHNSFLDWANNNWEHDYTSDDNFMEWLLDPSRFCGLVAEWLERRRKE